MRSDMGKLITERERAGGQFVGSRKYGETIRWLGFEADYEGPRRAKASAHGQYGWNCKEFTDVLGPIRGYLAKQVGRPWNKIYSEISAVLDKGKLTHRHVFDHIWNDFVERPGTPKSPWRSGHDFFIHPRTGLLCRRKKETKAMRAARWVKPPDPDLKKISPGKEYRRIREIWYYVEFHIEKLVGHPPREVIDRKKQLNTREIERLKDVS